MIQLDAIRAFFTDPQPRYNRDELRVIFGMDYPGPLDEDETAERSDVADFLRAYVSPVLVGRAAGDLDRRLALERVSIELPGWQLDGLRRMVDEDRGSRLTQNDIWSISDVLATEIESTITVGGTFDDTVFELIDYAKIRG